MDDVQGIAETTLTQPDADYASTRIRRPSELAGSKRSDADFVPIRPEEHRFFGRFNVRVLF